MFFYKYKYYLHLRMKVFRKHREKLFLVNHKCKKPRFECRKLLHN